MPSPQVIFKILLLHRVRPLVGDLVALVAEKYLGNIAFFGELDALPLRKLKEAPEQSAAPRGTPGMKAVCPPLLLAVTNREPCLASERLYALLNNGLGFIGILHRVFVESDGGV